MKKKLIFILLCVFILTVFTGCGGSSDNDNDVSDNRSGSQSVEAETESDTNDAEEEDIGYCHKYFDTTKFDASKFTGTIYDKNGTSYNVEELLAASENGSITLYTNSSYFKYYLTSDLDKEAAALRYSMVSFENNDDLEFIRETLGEPNCILEKYYDTEYGKTGNIGLLYDYGDYLIEVQVTDYSLWTDYSYTCPAVNSLFILNKSTWFSDSTLVGGINSTHFKDHTVYGTEIK